MCKHSYEDKERFCPITVPVTGGEPLFKNSSQEVTTNFAVQMARFFPPPPFSKTLAK